MQRILVLGSPGSGKTTLARQLGERLGLPVVHLDVLFWRPGWQKSDVAGFRERLTPAIGGGEWIIDGNFASLTFDMTLPHADAIVMLDRPRWLCLFRVLWRSCDKRRRPDLPEGCPETVDRELLRYVWRYPSVGAAEVETARLAHGPGVPVVRLTSNRAVAAFLAAPVKPST